MTDQTPDQGGELDFDLDALRQRRAAESETKGRPHRFRFAGRAFDLPPEPYYDAMEFLAAGNTRGGLALLLGDEQAEAFFAARPTVADLEEFDRAVGQLYGFTSSEPEDDGLGKSDGSPTSSSDASPRRKPTSKRRTG